MRAFTIVKLMISAVVMTSSMAFAQSSDEDILESNTAGKMEMAALALANDMIAEAQSRINNIDSAQNEIGLTQDDSQGVLKSLGEKSKQATDALNTMKQKAALLRLQSGDVFFATYNDIDALEKNIANIEKEALSLTKEGMEFYE